ncbi:PEP-utilizing enzyme [Mycobacterium sp.]|uniref:PEP-utilizing enzyme n=1 Tax=Mycobacterium sp. TaxID=1785 RepID=UPI002CF41A58|nr:PEP-utilizing enzyme [Mycobacterium sp.]HKP39869.1 PEP-utilizing enzyme [Mycobacterium sp.]
MTLADSVRGTAAPSDNDPTRGNSNPDTYWTTANIGEAAPSVMTPLCWSLWGPGNELAVLRCWHRFGLLGPDQVYVDPDQNNRLTGVFYGRQAMNVDAIRKWVDRFPGITADDFEFGLAGSVHPNPKPFPRLSDDQQALVADVVEQVRGTHTERLAAMVERQDHWWRQEVLRPPSGADPVRRLGVAFERFVWSIGIHNETRLLSVVSMANVYRIAAGAEALDLVPSVTSAFGDVAELSMAADLWSLSRGELAINTFIERHGFHGESEGNPAGRSWREAPSLLEPIVSALRSRDSTEHPERRAEHAVSRQRAALAELESRLDTTEVVELRQALSEIAVSVRQTELGKAAFLRAIDGFRAAARDLGAQLVEDGRIAAADDVFLFTLDELRTDRGASVSGGVLAQRSESVSEYRGYTLPTTFTGMPEPIVKSAARVVLGEVLTGVGASGRSYEGTVRIVRRTEDEDTLEPGEVLVCEATDPSWTPLFMLAEAVVIDIGSVGSHGAIVARELGLPAVVNTIDGSRRLRTGDHVLVDGAAGTVTVLALAAE